MELNQYNGYAIEHTMLILKEIYLLQHHAPYMVDGPHRLASPPVEATLFRRNGKLIPMFRHITEQLRFLVPAAAFTD